MAETELRPSTVDFIKSAFAAAPVERDKAPAPAPSPAPSPEKEKDVEPASDSGGDSQEPEQDTPKTLPKPDQAVPPPKLGEETGPDQATVAAPATSPTPTLESKPEPELDYKAEYHKLKTVLGEDKVAQQQFALSQQQQAQLRAVASRLERNQEAYASLYQDYQDAVEIQDYATIQKLELQGNSLLENIAAGQRELTARGQSYGKQQRELAITRQLAAIDKTVQTSAGTTLKALKEANPEADLTNPHQIINAVTKAVTTRYTKEIESLKEEVKGLKAQLPEAEKKARADWSDKSPAARVDRSALGGASGNTKTSTEDYLRAGLGLRK